jgi:glucose-1-phosphate adenylyltransferase
VDTTVLGLDSVEAAEKPYIASMGIYVFKKSTLIELLKTDYPNAMDFGGEIIPEAAKERKVQAYLFNDYWEDIGTIKSFFDANLSLAQQPPRFEFYDPQQPIYTSPRFLPPAKIEKSQIGESIISHGCTLAQCTIDNAVIGVRSHVEAGCVIEDTMLMGADFYESEEERHALLAAGKVPMGIGQGTTIRNSIVDKNARIGRNCNIVNVRGVEEENHEDEGYIIKSGIVVICRNAVIPDGTEI